jgi:hypothetical protein
MAAQQEKVSDATKPICGFIYVDNSGRKRRCRNIPLTDNGHCKVHYHSSLKTASPIVITESVAKKGPDRYKQLTVLPSEKPVVMF